MLERNGLCCPSILYTRHLCRLGTNVWRNVDTKSSAQIQKKTGFKMDFAMTSFISLLCRRLDLCLLSDDLHQRCISMDSSFVLGFFVQNTAGVDVKGTAPYCAECPLGVSSVCYAYKQEGGSVFFLPLRFRTCSHEKQAYVVQLLSNDWILSSKYHYGWMITRFHTVTSCAGLWFSF